MLRGPQFFRAGPTINGCDGIRPVSLAQFNQVTGKTAGALYICNQASGNVVDLVASANLVSSGANKFRRAVGGKLGVHCDEVAAQFSLAGANEPGTTSAIIGVVATMPTAYASLPGIIGKSSDTTFPCFVMYRANNTVGYFNLLVRDNGANTLLLSNASMPNIVVPNRAVLYLGQVDRAANIGRVYAADASRTIYSDSGTIAGFATLSGGANPVFGMGGFSSFQGGNAFQWGFYMSGVQCEGTNTLKTIASRLGYGPA